LNRIRTNHYSNVIADDLKLYVGPSNYPQNRVDETMFHTIKKMFENVLYESFERNIFDINSMPKFHDMYLFDGVIFIICQNIESKEWTEGVIPILNERLHLTLKSTEFRGAVGIVSMVVKSQKDADEIIADLQKQNPRLRTRYWRKISTVRSRTKLDVVLQIDKLSAQVITDPEFNKKVDGNTVQFKLGHLQSLLKPKFSLQALTKQHSKKSVNIQNDTKATVQKEKTIEELRSDLNKKYPALKIEQWDVISQNKKPIKVCNYEIDGTSSKIVEKSRDDQKPAVAKRDNELDKSPLGSSRSGKRVLLKVPSKLIPDNKEDLHMLFDLLEGQNPGLNTELWRIYSDSVYPSNGRFPLRVDKQSASVIKGKNFDPVIGGEKLKFIFSKS
jgi:hypothetical protein